MVPIQNLALNLAGLDDLFGERLQAGFGLKIEAEHLHLPDQSALPMTHFREVRALSNFSPQDLRRSARPISAKHILRYISGDYGL